MQYLANSLPGALNQPKTTPTTKLPIKIPTRIPVGCSASKAKAKTPLTAIITYVDLLKKEDLSEALKRHLLLYNCNVTAGGLILGTTIAMEEQRAKDPSKMPDMAITGLKTGLMGPVAALGDSFDWGIIGTLMKIAAATLAAAGNPLALVVLLLFVGYCIGELILTTNMTYKKGRESIKTIMGSGLMQDVISGANVLAMFMMGAMTASMVTLKTVLKISTVVVQDKLDSIFPNVFPLIVLFLIYWLIRKKKVGTGKIVIGIIAVSILLSFVGIF